MKSFLITITIIGAIVYGMLQINAYYDDKGACSWSLFGGGDYAHKERLDNVLNGFMREIIKQDKNARKELLYNQGKSEAEITKTLKALDPQYQREKQKIFEYCSNNLEKETYFQKKSMVVRPSKYCEIANTNNYDINGYTGLSVEYNFDKASYKFFNEVNYIFYNWKYNTFHLKDIRGIYVNYASSPCDTKYIYGGESGGIYGTTEKKVLGEFDKTKYIIYNKKDMNYKKGK